MATTLTNSDKAEIAQEAIEANLTLNDELMLFSTELGTEGLIKGDKLKVPVYGSTTAETFVKGSQNYSTSQAAAVVYKDVTLNQHFKSTFELDDFQASRADIMQLMRASKDAVVKQVLDYVYGLVTAANFTGTPVYTGAASGFDSDIVVDYFKNAKANGYDLSKLMMILNDDFGAALLKDPALKDASASLSGNTLREAEIGRLSKFSIGMSSVLPDNGESLAGFATDGSSLAVAISPVRVQENNTTFSEIVTDPVSGLTLNYREFYADDDGVKYGTFEAVAGASAVRDATLNRITTA